MLTIVLLGCLAFCRVVVGLIFALSSIGKARNLARFRQTIAKFGILPTPLNGLAVLVVVFSEVAVVILVAAGGALLIPGFILAMILLLVFCWALLLVQIRGIEASCNCFGLNEKPVSLFDVWRNCGFILCALGGCILVTQTASLRVDLNAFIWIFAAFVAAGFVAVWLHLREIIQIFHVD